MTNKLSLAEIYNTIQMMKQKLSAKGSVTHVFKRVDYEAVLVVLSDERDLLEDRGINIKVTVQNGILTVLLRRE